MSDSIPDFDLGTAYSLDLFGQVTNPLDADDFDLGCEDLQSPAQFLESTEESAIQTRTTSCYPTPSDFFGHTPSAELWLDTVLNSRETGSSVTQEIEVLSELPRLKGQPLLPSLQDNSSILVEYYFKEVCGMMSCYDSQMNPYRTTIANVWSRSPSLYYIVQSMAAACLSEVSPGFAAVGRQLRDRAASSLSQEISANSAHTSSLLALVMLGFSLSWHDAANAGQVEFELLAKAIFMVDAQPDDIALADMQRRVFFYNSFVYWKMLLSYVTDRELPCPAYPALHPQPTQNMVPQHTRVPHPQTGVAIQVQEILAQVGALLRKERKRIRSRRHTSKLDIIQAQAAIQSAERLKAQLCAIDIPSEESVMESGDDTTPVNHLVRVAEAYRCTGLLQLFQNFPDLFTEATAQETTNEALELQTLCDAANLTEDEHKSAANAFLTGIALHILDTIQDIPISSRSRSIQPLLLVSICSELSINRSFGPVGELQMNISNLKSLSESRRFKQAPPTIADILQARRSVLCRLTSFENVLAAKPIRQMIRLVKETWACMDERQEDVFWMDVMMDRDYETLMG